MTYATIFYWDDSAIGKKCLVFWVSLVDLVVYILAIQPMNSMAGKILEWSSTERILMKDTQVD